MKVFRTISMDVLIECRLWFGISRRGSKGVHPALPAPYFRKAEDFFVHFKWIVTIAI